MKILSELYYFGELWILNIEKFDGVTCYEGMKIVAQLKILYTQTKYFGMLKLH